MIGDSIKTSLKPFVKGTKYENCEACEKRRLLLNAAHIKIIEFFKKITCKCIWKRFFNIK